MTRMLHGGIKRTFGKDTGGQRVENIEDFGLYHLWEGKIFNPKYVSVAYLILTIQKNYRQLQTGWFCEVVPL